MDNFAAWTVNNRFESDLAGRQGQKVGENSAEGVDKISLPKAGTISFRPPKKCVGSRVVFLPDGGS
jgi:hypothetical protein